MSLSLRGRHWNLGLRWGEFSSFLREESYTEKVFQKSTNGSPSVTAKNEFAYADGKIPQGLAENRYGGLWMAWRFWRSPKAGRILTKLKFEQSLNVPVIQVEAKKCRTPKAGLL